MKYIIKEQETKPETEPEQTIELILGFDEDGRPVVCAFNLDTGRNAVVVGFYSDNDVALFAANAGHVGLHAKKYGE